MNILLLVPDLRQFSCFAILISDTLQGATAAMEPFSILPWSLQVKKLLPFTSNSRSFTMFFRS